MFIEELGLYLFNPDYIQVEDGGVSAADAIVTSEGRVSVKLTRMAAVTVAAGGKEFAYTTPIYSSRVALSREDSLSCFNDKNVKHPSETYVKYLEKNGSGAIADERVVKSIDILTARLNDKKLYKVVSALSDSIEAFDSAQALDAVLNNAGSVEVPCDCEDCAEETSAMQQEVVADETTQNEEVDTSVSIIGDTTVGETPITPEVAENETTESTAESIL